MHGLTATGDPTSGANSVAAPPEVPRDASMEAVRACKILVVDDEEPNVRLLERVLSRAGFDNFVSTTNSREAAALFTDFEPDLVLTDWLMPGVDGCALIGLLRALMATDDFLPIVVLTADITPQTRKRALNAGATDFLTKPFDQIEVLLRIQNLLRARLSHLVVQKQNATLEESVRQRTIELERALTELQQTQKQVIQQERLAALGTMAGGIAHDFNNALSVIMGFGELLLRDAEHGLTKEHAMQPLATILTAAEDAAKIVHRLRQFYRPDEAEEMRTLVDLNEVVRQSVLLTQPRWQTAATASGRTITIATELGDIPRMAGDAAELREVLTNLIFNAVDAMPSGGAITLGTAQEGEDIALSITDSGTGMSDEVRQRCLEPFFTTKGHLGTGFGLSMVFGIVRRHAGTIEIESKVGAGTTITLRMPKAGAATEEIITGAEALPDASEPMRILIVDDQPVLCQILRQILQEDLHTVESALGGSEALEKFRADDFDLVITDHVMADMTGAQLATTVKELKPHVPVILLTGYASGASAENKYPEAIDLVLGKPLSRVELRRAMWKMSALRLANPQDPVVV